MWIVVHRLSLRCFSISHYPLKWQTKCIVVFICIPNTRLFFFFFFFILVVVVYFARIAFTLAFFPSISVPLHLFASHSFVNSLQLITSWSNRIVNILRVYGSSSRSSSSWDGSNTEQQQQQKQPLFCAIINMRIKHADVSHTVMMMLTHFLFLSWWFSLADGVFAWLATPFVP